MSEFPAARSLAACCIVTTRPAAQAQGLKCALEALGAEVINFPVIAIEAASPERLQTLDLGVYALAFFVSPNAVEHAFRIRARAAWPETLRVATVGPASAQALTAHGWREVICPTADFDSESVLALPEFSADQVAGRKVLVVRGEGGRELLADTLRERGAQVDQISVYHRCRATLDPAPLLARAARSELSALVFSASEGLRFFLDITAEAGLALLHAVPCFAPHPRILEALKKAGAARPVLTAPGDAGIIEGLVLHLQQGGRASSGAPRTPD